MVQDPGGSPKNQRVTQK